MRRCRAGAALAAVLLLGPAGLLSAWTWGHDMERQPSIGPFETDFPPPAGIRHVGSRDRAVDRMDTHGRLRDPAPEDTTTVRAGERLFGIYCTPCHGPGGAGDGPVTEKFIPPPPLFPLVGMRTDGYLHGTIRFGGPIMPPYGEELQDDEIWSIIRWLRRENARRGTREAGG